MGRKYFLLACLLWTVGGATLAGQPDLAARGPEEAEGGIPVWFGEAFPDGLLVLSESDPRAKAIRFVTIFSYSKPLKADRVEDGPPPQAAQLFGVCDGQADSVYPKLARFRAGAGLELKEATPVVAWAEGQAIEPFWIPGGSGPRPGWEAAARKAAGKAELGLTLAGIPVPLASGKKPGVYAQLRNYRKQTGKCRFPFVELALVLDDRLKLVGSSSTEACFEQAPFDWMMVVEPCGPKDARKECRWPPASHAGPDPGLREVYGPGRIPLGLMLAGQTLWVRLTRSFEGEHLLVEKAERGKVVQVKDVYFYHCAF